MAGTTLVALKANLKLAIKAALPGIEVHYGQRPNARTENIWLGEASLGSQEPAGLRQGRKRRHEDYEVQVFVNVVGKASPEKNETRAVELVSAIETLIADNPTVDQTPGLMWVTVEEMEWSTTETGEGPSTTVRIQLNARGNIL